MNTTSSNIDSPESRESQIRFIMEQLGKVDTTISAETIEAAPELGPDVQDNEVITNKARTRLESASPEEIQEIFDYLIKLNNSGIEEEHKKSHLLELKVELASNVGKPIHEIITELNNIMKPSYPATTEKVSWII